MLLMYENIMSEEVDMNDENEDEIGVNEEYVDCSDAFNTSQTQSVAYKIGFVTVIMRSDINIGMKGMTSFVLIGCERSDQYRSRKKDFVRRDTGSRKCGCHFKFRWKPVCHPDAVKLCNACNLVFLIDSTYKTNRYKLPLLDFVGVIPTGMTFSIGFAYLEGERLNNVVWALEQFRGIFLRHDALPVVTDKDLTLMNTVKTVFPECTNFLCRFHIDKNVKYAMDAWGSLVDYRSKHQFDDCLKKFEIACSPWPMFVDYVNETWIIPHKEKFVKAWTNKVMYLGNTATNRLLQNNLGDLCSVWDAMNNMITLQHIEIKASFEASTYVVEHVFKITLYKRLLGMISRYALNQIVAEYERVHYADKNPSRCGCVMRITHSLPCTCELSKYVLGIIPLETIHMFWRRLSFSDQGLSEPQVTITEEMETISKRFEELDVCGKATLKSQHQRCTEEIDDQTPKINKAIPRRIMPMLDQFHPFIHNFIENIVDVKADDNYGYRAIAVLLGMGEDSWSLVHNHLLKELYINLFSDIDKLEELKRSLLVDGVSMVTVDKWMDITDMGYVIASRYNVILVSLSLQQSMTFFPLRSQPPTDSFVHRVICIGHVFGNHFVQVYLKDRCPLPPLAFLWSRNCHP
ncbi:Protein FAR1-RELATED SEQUENCE 5 [Glycine soja]